MTSEKTGRTALCDALLDLARSPDKAEELARLLAEILPAYAAGPLAAKYFRLWEEHGFHLTPVHFYQPIPDTRALPDALWQKPSELVGVDMNEAGQLDLLRNVFPEFHAEYDAIPIDPTGAPHEFYLKNGAFEGTDALVLYRMVRETFPKSPWWGAEVSECGESSRPTGGKTDRPIELQVAAGVCHPDIRAVGCLGEAVGRSA
jgi:hypothetical protein